MNSLSKFKEEDLKVLTVLIMMLEKEREILGQAKKRDKKKQNSDWIDHLYFMSKYVELKVYLNLYFPAYYDYHKRA